MSSIKRVFFFCFTACVYWTCVDDPKPIDCEVSGPIMSLGTVTNATSCSVPDGSIKVSATGGKEPYLFSLNDDPGQEEGVFTNLHAGYYTVKVVDANGCSKSVDNVSVKASDFQVNAVIEPDKLCIGGDGQITINIEPINPPYQFKLGTGSFSASNTFTNLAMGTYGITVQDNIGCSVFLSVTVPRDQSNVSWNDVIKPIIEKSCAKSGCHDGGARVDLRVFQNAKANARSMKSKTQDRSMPREGTLTQDEIDLIACWVDDGALLN